MCELKNRRWLAISMTFLLIFELFFGQVLDSKASVSDQTVEIKASTITAKPGETVDVSLSLKNNPGILGTVLQLKYDNGLTLISSENGQAFNSLAITKPGKLTSHCRFVWDALELDDSEIKDGDILSLKFKVSEDIKESCSLGIELSCKSGDVVDRNLNSVEPMFVNGKVNVRVGPVIIKTGETDSGFQYEVRENDQVYITGYVGMEKDIVCPDRIDSSQVNGIKSDAFSDGSDLNSLMIPSEITEFEPDIFSKEKLPKAIILMRIVRLRIT